MSEYVLTAAVFPRPALLLSTLLFSLSALAADGIVVENLIVDPPTLHALGFSVPISGDDDYDAAAQVSYRKTGSQDWQPALPLLRVRPEFVSSEDPPEGYGLSRPGPQFAGSVMNLDEDTQYEVMIEITDPDGGSRTQTVVAQTRATPRRDPVNANVVSVANSAQLQEALSAATPGDLILLGPGTYTGGFSLIGRSGTADNPIVVRGQGPDTIIELSGASAGFYIHQASYVHVESLRIAGVSGSASYGVDLSDGEGLVARDLIIEGDNGIDASYGVNRDFYICDNTLIGPNAWPELAIGGNVNIKGLIAIAVSGKGHVVCHNETDGFGSSLFVRMNGASTDNIAIDFYNNDVLNSADDGIELDGSMRNVRAWENRITNALMGISFQPVWGGPVYAIRNIVFNTAAAPYKMNNDPSGLVLLHNTAFRYRETDISGPYDGNAWPQLGEPGNYAANVWIANNIFAGADAALFIRQEMEVLSLDTNGYWPNGEFGLQIDAVMSTSPDLAAFAGATGFEVDGTALTQPIFADSPPVAADYKAPAPRLTFALSSQSNARDAGATLANVNDGYRGAAPDLGVAEYGDEATSYGPRDAVAPADVPRPPVILDE